MPYCSFTSSINSCQVVYHELGHDIEKLGGFTLKTDHGSKFLTDVVINFLEFLQVIRFFRVEKSVSRICFGYPSLPHCGNVISIPTCEMLFEPVTRKNQQLLQLTLALYLINNPKPHLSNRKRNRWYKSEQISMASGTALL